MDRRGFLKSMLALGAAPAIVKAESLMKLYVPRQELIVLYGDGIHDDTAALQTWFDGGLVIRPDGAKIQQPFLSGGRFRITNTITLNAAQTNGRTIVNSYVDGRELPRDAACFYVKAYNTRPPLDFCSIERTDARLHIRADA